MHIALCFTSVANIAWDSFIPLAINRLILSLKKARSSPDTIWSTIFGQPEIIGLPQRTIGGSERRGDGGGIALKNL